MTMNYARRAACKISVLVEGVLLTNGAINLAQIAKFEEKGIKALHLISFVKLGKDGQGLPDYIAIITQLESALGQYTIEIASFRANVYNPDFDESINENNARLLHAQLRWPQRWLSVVYGHHSQNIPYMLAMNGSDVFYHAGQPVDYPLIRQIEVA